MTQQEKYRFSLYTNEKLLRETASGRAERVKSTLDGKTYIKKTYPADKREIFQILSQVKNIHIPEIKEIFFSADTIVIEEDIPGETLEQRMKSGSLSKKEVCRLFRGLIDAVEVLHNHDIIHRDIKPSNVMLRPDGEAVLIDYGIARLYSENREKDTEMLGTEGYAAPEQFGFSQSNRRTDIFGLGQTMKQVLAPQNASRTLIRAVTRCGEFDPSRRFSSAADIRAYFQRTKRTQAALSAALGLAIGMTGLFCLSKAGGSGLVYSPAPDRIVEISMAGEDIPCLPMPEDGTYRVSFALKQGGPKVKVAAERNGDFCRLTVNKSEFFFADDHSLPTDDYPGGETFMEILFYDMDADGEKEVLPVICNGRFVEWPDGSAYLLKNYTLAWCVLRDEEGFSCDPTRMEAILEDFHIHGEAPGCLWTDFPNYYSLEKRRLVQKR